MAISKQYEQLDFDMDFDIEDSTSLDDSHNTDTDEQTAVDEQDRDTDELESEPESKTGSKVDEVESESSKTEVKKSNWLKKDKEPKSKDKEPKSKDKAKSTKKNKKTKTSEQTDEVEEVVKEDMLLYIITDKTSTGLAEYFRNYGVHVSQVFTSITSARDTLLMSMEKFRLVVIESGTGRFASMIARKDLIDLLGICDEDVKITVFYTDSVIKSEVTYADETEDKPIQWLKFRSTVDVLANLLKLSQTENYKYDSNEIKDNDSSISNLNITGLPVTTEKEMDLGKPLITLLDIKMNMIDIEKSEKYKDLKSYKVTV